MAGPRLDTKDDQDTAPNPSQQDYDAKFNDITSGYSSSSDTDDMQGIEDYANQNSTAKDLQKLENYANNSSDSDRYAGDPHSKTDQTVNAKDQEEGGGWDDKYSGNQPKRGLTLSSFKKKGPLGLILGLLFGGGAGMTLLFSPGIALVQLKEIMVGDLNDQVRAMEVFDDHLMRAKLKSLRVGGVSLCSNKASFRCKFSTMSKREVQRFKDAGFTIEPDEPDKSFGRTKPTKLIFPDGVDVNNPNELNNYIRNNPIDARRALRQAFNPKFAGLYDKVAAGVFDRFKTNRAQKVEGATDEERDKAMDAATAGESVGIDAKGHYTDSEGREYVLDEDGTAVYKEDSGNLPEGSVVDEDNFNEIVENNLDEIDDIASKAEDSAAGSKAMDTVGSAVKGVSALGAFDSACGVYNGIRAVAAAAKITRSVQLAQYAVVFFNVADRIKAGVATPEEVTYLGDKITAVDTRKEVVDEDSVWEGDSREDAEPKPHENPYYGANGFDSAGYKTAAYNEAPILTSQDSQFLIGGGIAGSMTTILNDIASIAGGKENIREFCGVVQSWWARSAGLIAGIASAIGTFGTSTVVSIGASVAIGFAMPFLQAALADIIAGKTVSSKTKGVDSLNAAFPGTGALMGGLAQGHGLKPSGAKDMKSYFAATEDTHQQHIAAERAEAKDTPFDVYNQYSFLGSAVRKINPSLIKSTASVSGALTNIPSILGIAASSIVPSANAAQGFNPERYNKCPDEGYETLGIDADIFCNVRYSMSDRQLEIEPDEAAKWMEDNGHVNTDGSTKSEEYENWLVHCANRTDGYGETGEDDNNEDEAIGLNCVTKDKDAEEIEQLEYFGAYHMMVQIQDTKDNGYVTGAASAQSSGVTPEMCKTLPADDLGQIACKAYQFDDYGYLWAGGHGGTASGFMKRFKAGEYQAGKDAILDCSGLVRMSIFDATGYDIGGMSTNAYPNYKKFKKISKDEAKAGDIIWHPGHTELVVSNNPGSKRFKTIGAHTDGIPFDKQIGPTTYNYGSVSQVFRFQK